MLLADYVVTIVDPSFNMTVKGLTQVLANRFIAQISAGVEISKIYGVGHFWNFNQISFIIVDRVLTVEWDHSFS